MGLAKSTFVTYCYKCSVDYGVKGIIKSSEPKPRHPAISVSANQRSAKCPKCEDVFATKWYGR